MRFPSLKIFTVILLGFISVQSRAFNFEAPSKSCHIATQEIATQLEKIYGHAQAAILVSYKNETLMKWVSGEHITTDTPFLLGSVSKSFNAALTLRLIEENLIDLDQIILNELPKYFVRNLNPSWGKITLRNLLNHTSGIQDFLNRTDVNEQPKTDEYLSKRHSFKEILRTVPAPLFFEPRTNYRYSNTNYWLIAHIIKNHTGRSFSESLKREIFRPLNLTHSGVLNKANSKIKGSTSVYPSNLNGMGNVYSSASDLLKFISALDQDDFLNNKSLQQMFSPDPLCSPGENCTSYGFGFRLGKIDLNGIDLALHEGHLKNVSSLIAKASKIKLNISLVSDLGGINNEELTHHLIEILLDTGCVVYDDHQEKFPVVPSSAH